MHQFKQTILAVSLVLFNFITAQQDINTDIEKIAEKLSRPYRLSNTQKNELKELISISEKEINEVQKNNYFNVEIAKKKVDYLKAKAQLRYLQKLNSFNLEKPIFLNNDERQKVLIENGKKIKLDVSKLNEIIKLYVDRELRLKEFQFTRLNAVAYANDLIDFHEHTYDVRAIHENYSEKIAQLLTIHEYEALFKESLLPIIERTSEKRLAMIAANYEIREEKHLKSLKSITDFYAKEKIIAQHYYTYDRKELHIVRVNHMFNEMNAIEKAIKSLNINPNGTLDLTFDARAPFFVERAKKAGISDVNIKRLVFAIKEHKRKNQKYFEDLAIWESKYLIYYFHSGGTPEEYTKELKRRVSELMTIDQFKEMFGHQFNGRIEKEANKRIAKVRFTYRKLSSSRLKKLTDMITEQVKHERVLYEYYSYDHENAMQKLRASKYKFDKKFKTAMEEILKS